jgi:hypothetical protein
VATIPLVVVQISAVAAPVTTIAAKITPVAAFRPAILAEVAAIPSCLSIPAIGAVAPKIAPVCAPIAVVGAEVAPVASDIAAVAAEIATIGADVARIPANVAGSPGSHRLRARDRGSTGRERHRDAKCNQCVAKHCEILQGSVGARREHRVVRGSRRLNKWRVKASAHLAFRKKDGIVPRRAGLTRSSGRSALPINGLRPIRGRIDSFADSG